MRRRDFLGASAAAALAARTAIAAEARTTGPSPSWTDNPVIQASRRAALDLLKPSRKDLEHGLELHAGSVVFDIYGFSPRAAVDGDAIRKAIETGASAAEVKDLRERMMMTRYVDDPAERAEFVQAWEASGVTCVFQNAGEEGQDPLRLIKRLAHFTYATDRLRDFMPKAVTPDDIVQAKREKRRCLYFTANGVPLGQQWTSVEEELGYLRVFFELGIRMMHLAYQRRNMIGDGCAEPADAGLSDFGRTVVAEMNRIGLIVDVTHAGWRTGLEAAKASTKPMVDSHTVCASLYKHIRGKPDEVIRAIVETDGLVGICAIPTYLGGTGDIHAFLDHIDHVVRRFGVDHVAIGTDRAYPSRNSAAENRKIPEQPKARRDFLYLWPDGVFRGPPTMRPKGAQSLDWTNWPLFTVGLVQRGYSDEAIQKILAGNMLRVARAALAG